MPIFSPQVHVGTAQPQFEAALVRPAAESSLGGWGFNGGPGTADPGHFNVHGASLFDLILLAHTASPYQVTGPEWLKTVHFDIVAKLPGGPGTRPEMMSMLRQLLETRFKTGHAQGVAGNAGV